ncbi:hypothetical protein F8M41_018891 [Gigaspora margarita]|uniref:Uncharacterized protein n=1 Tax=Gigaspora margarita TaxID=4874 RepID=A0A8H4AL03_GIGMA|nr:hypothetical protein F8M41_018891 [Gigaspora margarita]
MTKGKSTKKHYEQRKLKCVRELEALKDIRNKILALQERYIEFQDVSENNDSYIPLVSASANEITCEKVQEGPSNIESRNAVNAWAIDNDEGNIQQEEMVYDKSDKAKDNNDTNPYPRDRQ